MPCRGLIPASVGAGAAATVAGRAAGRPGVDVMVGVARLVVRVGPGEVKPQVTLGIQGREVGKPLGFALTLDDLHTFAAVVHQREYAVLHQLEGDGESVAAGAVEND